MYDINDFLDLETEHGVPVRNYRPLGGHYIVYKVPMKEGSIIALPEAFKARAVKNIVAIKGLVLCATERFRPKKAIRYWEWDMKQDPPTEMPKYKVVDLPEVGATVNPGDHILYNSFNVAHVNVIGLSEPLVVIRDCDLLAAWDADYDDQVELSDHALTHLIQKANH
jgi:hypothetical protein